MDCFFTGRRNHLTNELDDDSDGGGGDGEAAQTTIANATPIPLLAFSPGGRLFDDLLNYDGDNVWARHGDDSESAEVLPLDLESLLPPSLPLYPSPPLSPSHSPSNTMPQEGECTPRTRISNASGAPSMLMRMTPPPMWPLDSDSGSDSLALANHHYHYHHHSSSLVVPPPLSLDMDMDVPTAGPGSLGWTPPPSANHSPISTPPPCSGAEQEEILTPVERLASILGVNRSRNRNRHMNRIGNLSIIASDDSELGNGCDELDANDTTRVSCPRDH